MKPVHPTIRLSVTLAAAALLVLAIGPAQERCRGRSVGARRTSPHREDAEDRPGPDATSGSCGGRCRCGAFVLKVDLSKAITLDTTIADDALPSRRQLSRIVRNHEALAGVNGDPGEGLGNTVHPFAQDGDLLHTAGPDAEMFAVSKDESSTFLGNPKLKVNVTDQSNGRVFTLDRWNRRAPEPGEIVGFSPLGGTLASPPSFSCSVRLAAAGPPQVADPDGVDRDYVVDVATCSESPLDRNGGVVISTAPGTDEAEQLLALTPGTPMRLHWTLGWPGVFDAVGGDPILLLDGAQTPICVSCARQPSNRDRRHGHRTDPPGRDRRPPAPDGRVGATLGELESHPAGPWRRRRAEPGRWRLVRRWWSRERS